MNLDAGDGGAQGLDVGTLLLGMALDVPPPVTVSDAMPAAESVLDAANAALFAAIMTDDAANDARSYAMWRERQNIVLEMIREAL